ncbi:uncharacterized protein LOC144422717 isoform X2 [Styela clava]
MLFFVTLISFAIVGCISGSCVYNITGDRRCKHTFNTSSSVTTKFYEVGEVWNDKPCVECRCNIASYHIHLNCSLLTPHGFPEPVEVETYFEDIDRNNPPPSCPLGFTEMKESNKHLPSLLLIVYRIIESVATSCCNKQTIAILPAECEAIPHDSDSCKYRYVLKSSNNVECPGNIIVSG